MRKQYDSATDLSVRSVVDRLESARAQQCLENDGQFEKAEARAEATLDSAAERDPGIGRRARVDEALGPELVRMVIRLGIQVDLADVRNDACLRPARCIGRGDRHRRCSGR